MNKRTGGALRFGSAFPLERDLAMYERGYQFPLYDLVVTPIHGLDVAERALGRLPIRVTEPSYEHGQVWRVARAMTREERLVRLATLRPSFPRYSSTSISKYSRRRGSRAGSTTSLSSIAGARSNPSFAADVDAALRKRARATA